MFVCSAMCTGMESGNGCLRCCARKGRAIERLYLDVAISISSHLAHVADDLYERRVLIHVVMRCCEGDGWRCRSDVPEEAELAPAGAPFRWRISAIPKSSTLTTDYIYMYTILHKL